MKFIPGKRSILLTGIMTLTFLQAAHNDVISAQGYRSSLAVFKKLNHHYAVSPEKGVLINWTVGYISASAQMSLPRIAFDPRLREYHNENTVRNITEARDRAREQAREKAELRLYQALGRIRLNSEYTFYERIQAFPEFRDRMSRLHDLWMVRSRRTGEGKVSIELTLPFYGSHGLFTFLQNRNNGRDDPPASAKPLLADGISGIIVDLRHIKGYKPALEPRIYSDTGRRIYGPDIARRECFVRRGPVAYFKSREAALRSGRLGRNPYYTLAGGLHGAIKSDVFLDRKDLVRILGSSTGRKALKNCAVAFILPPSR